MGPFKPANYAQWAEHLDLISDDAYPDPNDPEGFRAAAFQRDLVRSLKPEVPWILMEQATNALNWRPANAPKAPGQMAALSAQAIGRGADGILFFQWRQSKAGAEKFHSAMLPHAGTATRTWREVTALGGQLAALPTLPAGTRDARVALVFDWENWWTVEASDHPQNQLDYLAVVQRWYRALHRRHVQVDIVPPERVDGQYALAIAPLLYLLRDEGAAALTAYVEGGGHLIAGPFTDVVDECDRFRDGGFLTQLGALCGVRVEDFGALVAPDAPVTALGEREARVSGAALGEVIGTLLAEEIEIEASDATVEASFTSGRRAGRAALTVRRAGRGVARYLATVPDEAGALAVIDHVLADSGVAPVVAGLPEHVEAARRGELVTLVHHGGDPVDVPIAGVDALTGERIESVRLEAFDWALVLQR
jgi:beta-galactosidase